jgi:hypothetical protein
MAWPRRQKQVATVGDVGEAVAAEQPEQGLVDCQAGLERVAGPLATHQAARRAPQLTVDGPLQLIAGVLMTCANVFEEDGQVIRPAGAHPLSPAV